MTSTMFHNDTASLNDLWYESHKNLIASVCISLKKEKEIGRLVDELLGKKMKTKKLKDPNKPKRAKSGYLYFCDEKREGIMESLKGGKEGISISVISKKLGSLWKKLDNKDKYNKLAEEDKERYEQEMENYNH